MRLEDLDERVKDILSGIASKSPKDALISFKLLLQGADGGKVLQEYVLLSPKCTEIVSLWPSERGSECAVPLLQLLNEIMRHPIGKADDLQNLGPERQELQVIRVRIDKVARFIVSTKLKDIYAHLTSGERTRQCAALHLLASIVKRSALLASELVAGFDFTLNVLPNLAKASKFSEDKKGHGKQRSSRFSTRAAFIDFAMSFLEVCHASLLRWVLQIRPLYGGVLHRLANDDETTIISVLKLFQSKVLDGCAMVPPGLQSAVFGDSALEQLANISFDALHSDAAQAAHDILLQLCTDVSHGICPDPSSLWGSSPGKAGSFSGGQGRLVRLMIKLKATESQNHRNLLLAIAAKRPMLVAAYFESFPYSLEPRMSDAWFSAAGLVSDIISVSRVAPPLEPLASQGLPPPTINSPLPQGILRSTLPRALTRLVINRGLQHANLLVKHGCLRMLSEVLSAGEFYLHSIRKARYIFQQKCIERELKANSAMTMDEACLGNNLDMVTLNLDDGRPFVPEHEMCKEMFECRKWIAFESNFQNELHSNIPDPQVLFSLLSIKSLRGSDPLEIKEKKINAGIEDELMLELERDDLHVNVEDGEALFTCQAGGEVDLVDIWNADESLIATGDLEDVEGFLNAKLLEVLATYKRILPNSIVESSFDVFKLLPEDPFLLTLSQQKALLILLLAASGDFSEHEPTLVGLENLHWRHMFRHLKPILKFTLGSKSGWVKHHAQILANRAMCSSGAFEINKTEVGIWLQLVPLSDSVVLSFLCDAVDTVGRNMDKHMETLSEILQSTSQIDNNFAALQFGPFVICILDKCLRVLKSSSKNLKLFQRTGVCIYVANALGLLLQSQVHPEVLATVIDVFLSSKLEGSSINDVNFKSEWSPLQNLLLNVQHLRRQEMHIMHNNLFHFQTGSLKVVLKFCEDDMFTSIEAKALALSSCLQCIPPQELAENIPKLMEIHFSVFKGRLPVLVGLFGAYPWLFAAILKLWPDLVDKALESAFVLTQSKGDMKENTSLCQMHKLSLPKHVEPDLITKENPSDMCFSERTAFAFSVFLLSLPFTIIFPAAANCYDDELWGSPQLYNIFLIALSEVPPLLWFPAASLILYWAEIFWERHCREDVFVKNQLEVCFALLKWMILPSETHGWLSLLQSTEEVSTNFSLVAQFLQGILMHPFMNRQFFQVAESTQYTATFESDDRSAPELGESQALEKWFQICASKSPSVYCHITLVFENLLLWASEPQRLDSLSMSKRHWQLLRRVIFFASKSFLNEICCSVKTVCSKGDQQCRLSPWFSFHLASKFSSYISFDAMVDLSCTLLSEKHINNEITTCCSSSLHMPCHIVGLYFGTLTFNRIICSFQNGKLQDSALFHNIKIQELYQKLLHIVLTAPSEMAFSCLLIALESHSRINYFSSGAWMHASSPFCDTPPMELLPSLMRDINEKKAKIILHLVQSSQCHLVQFAEELSYNLGVGGARLLRLAPLVSGCSLVKHCPGNALYTMQDMVSILPPVNWLIDVAKHQSHIVHCKVVQQIISAYYRQILEILRDLEIFNTPLNMDEVRPYLESKDYHKKFFRCFGSTGSGQVVNMLKHCLDHNCFSNVNREIVFSSITEKSYPLIDASIRRIDEFPTKETLKIANIVIAKSMAARLLFLTDRHDLNAKHTQSIAAAEDNHLAGLTGIGSNKIGSMIFDVVNILTSTLCVLFRQAPEDTGDYYGKDLDVSGVPVSISKSEVLRVVERSLLEDLRTVLKATADIHFETQDLSSLRKLTKSVLKFRFGESLPMQVLRLYASKSVQVPDFARHYAEYGLKLLVAHSRFSSTLLSFSGSSMENSLLKKYISDDSKSLPSILSMMKVPYRHAAIDKPMSEVKEDAANCISKLEILKFLRLLFYLKRQVAALDVSMEQAVDHSELLSLLLASYGASLNEVDTQNFLLMQEMETFKGANYAGLAGLDYLWGEAALKWRQENMSAECALNAARFPDEGTSRELRKKCFKEGLALDLTRCALGILFFPSRRNFPFTEILDGGHEFEEKTLALQSDESLLQNSAYDPRFLLQFSLHSLSCGWINANEFVLKGLLALALMSTASAGEDMRKLGYEVLAKFLAVLEEGPSFKGKPQIRLLLIVVKNSVLEPWQRLPSSAALFAAEASCLLMTPSDVHYTIVSKFLCRAACLDVEGVPLFKSMFRSGSVYFRSDRSWILRLLVFSLRTSFDAHIYRRQFIVEILMSFYGSPLGDNHTREWILEILFRASKIRTLAQHLVEHSGMLSWLTTVVCSNGAAKSGEYVGGVSSELSFKVLQIFENLLEWRSVKRWLVSEGFEELLKMAIVLHNILVESPKFIEPAIFIEPYLIILGTAFRLSQSRRKSQSHLHLPLADLSALIECIDTQKATTHHIQMLALKTILEVQPPACSIQERNYLWTVGAWMLSVGLKNLKVWHLSLERDNSMDKKDRAITLADSKNLLATIYAWLNASLILGKSGGAFQGADTAWSFLEGIKRPEPCDSFCRSDRDKDIIQLLICQQCLLGTSVTNISAVCAVLILLPSMEGPFGTFIEDNSNFFEWPLRQLPFPSELSSSWQWRAFECTSTASLFEYETCQMLFAMFQKLVDMKDKNKLDDLVKTLQLDLVAYARSERAGELEDVQFGPALWKYLQTVLTNPSD